MGDAAGLKSSDQCKLDRTQHAPDAYGTCIGTGQINVVASTFVIRLAEPPV